MTDKEFDKIINSKLSHFETTVSSNLWDKIAADTQKKRKVLPWWQTTAYLYPMAAVALLAVGIATFWLSGESFSTPSKNKPSTISTTIPQQPTKTQEQTNTKQTSTNPEKTELTNTNRATHSAERITPIDSANAVTNKKEVLTKAPSAATLYKQQKTKQPLTVEQINEKHLKDAVVATNITDPDHVLSKAISTPPITELNNLKASSVPNYSWESLGKQTIVSLHALLPAPRIPTITAQPVSSIQNKLSCPNTTKSNLFIDFFASPNLAMQQVRGTGASPTYLLMKDSSERMQIGFTLGGRITKMIGQHWSVSAGIQYTQSNQQFIQKTENERKTTVVLVTRSITNDFGVTTTYLDTSSITEIGYRTKRNLNQFKSIEIPVTTSYLFGNTNWQFGLHLGTVLGISNSYTGTTYDKNGNLITIDNATSPVYRTQIQVGLIGGVGIYRKVNYQTSLFVEPHFRYAVTNNQATALNFNQKIHLTGINAGVRFQLNNLSKSSISLQ